MRDRLSLRTQVICVSAEGANGYAMSLRASRPGGTNRTATFADGMATRQPEPEAVAIINRSAERIVEVSEAGIAALMKERDQMHGKRVGLILSGGNIDADKLALVLTGGVPQP